MFGLARIIVRGRLDGRAERSSPRAARQWVKDQDDTGNATESLPHATVRVVGNGVQPLFQSQWNRSGGSPRDGSAPRSASTSAGGPQA